MPGGARRYLAGDERQVVAVRRHAVLVARPFLEFLAVLVIVGWLTAQPRLDSAEPLWWLVLAAAARFVWKLADWSAERFVVTSRRVMLISGLVTRKVAVMPLVKVTDMTYERSIPGRLLGFGSFVMESAGQDQALRRVDFLPHPDALYRDLSGLLFSGGPTSPRTSPATGGPALPPGLVTVVEPDESVPPGVGDEAVRSSDEAPTDPLTVIREP